MRGDIDLREINLRKLRFSRRTLWLAAVLVLVALAGWGAWRYVAHPPKPFYVRWRLNSYLKKESHTSSFKVDFPFPSKAEMAKPSKKDAKENAVTKGSRTGKDFDALRDEYLSLKTTTLQLERTLVRAETEAKERNAKLEALTTQLAQAQSETDAAAKVSELQSNLTTLREQIAASQKSSGRRPELAANQQALAPIVDDLWEFQRVFAADHAAGDGNNSAALTKARGEFASGIEQKIATASSYESMYHAIGQQLFVAKRLLESGNPAHRRLGVTTAFTAARHALNYAMNGSVAARICEGYILPNIDLATDTNPRSTFSDRNFITQCADLFERNNEFNNVVRTYEMFLAIAKNPAQADWARSQMAMACERGGNPKQAVAIIREIKDTNTYSRLIRRIPRLQQDAGMKR